jgi:hypothetical protein
MNHWFAKNIKKKNGNSKDNLDFIFPDMTADNQDTLLSVLMSSQHGLSEVRRHAISHTHLPLLLGGLLGEGEAGQLALQPWLTHQQ